MLWSNGVWGAEGAAIIYFAIILITFMMDEGKKIISPVNSSILVG